MTPSRTRSLLLVFFALVALLMAACGGTDSGQISDGGTDAPAEELSVQFAWLHTIEQAGFYMAESEGFYADQNLTVDLRAGGPAADGSFIDHVREVLSGNADIGMVSGDRLLVERANGNDLVAIATLYQRSPIAFISMPDSGITKPEDFIGATVQVDDVTGSTGIAYLALMADQNIDREQIDEQPRTSFSTDPLTSGEMDVITAFVTNQPVQLELQGIDVNVILAADYGIDIYPNVMFATSETIATRGDAIQRFLNATIQGMQVAVDDPEAAAAVTVSYDENLDLESETLSMIRSIPLMAPAGSQLAMMTPERWVSAHDLLLGQGVISEALDVEDAYTLDFLNAFYGK